MNSEILEKVIADLNRRVRWLTWAFVSALLVLTAMITSGWISQKADVIEARSIRTQILEVSDGQGPDRKGHRGMTATLSSRGHEVYLAFSANGRTVIQLGAELPQRGNPGASTLLLGCADGDTSNQVDSKSIILSSLNDGQGGKKPSGNMKVLTSEITKAKAGLWIFSGDKILRSLK